MMKAALTNKTLWFGVVAAFAALFIYDALTGQLKSNKSVFNPASYK